MTSFKIFKLVLVLVFTFIGSEYNYCQFIKDYNLRCPVDSGADYGRSIIYRIDGQNGYAISGYTESNCSIGATDWMFMRYNTQGFLNASRLIGFNRNDECYSLIQSRNNNDSGYVLAGFMTDTVFLNKRATFVKLNKNLSFSSSKCIGDIFNSSYLDVIEDGFKNWAFSGYIEMPISSSNYQKILVSNYHNTGIVNFCAKYLTYSSPTTISSSNEIAKSICFQSADSTFGVAIKTNFFSSSRIPTTDIMIMKLSKNGSVIWNKVYREFTINTPSVHVDCEPNKIIEMNDGGFIIVGTAKEFNGNFTDIIVMRVGPNGKHMWTNIYGNLNVNESGNSIIFDGNLFLTGKSEIPELPLPYKTDALLMMLPVTGGPPMWTRNWNPACYAEGFDLIKSSPFSNGYAVVGYRHGTDSNRNCFIWKTNTNGEIQDASCNSSLNKPNKRVKPIIDSITIIRNDITDMIYNPEIRVIANNTDTLCLPDSSVIDNNKSNRENLEHSDLYLSQNNPNPFNSSTNIEYEIKSADNVSIVIYDITGRQVNVLLNEYKSAGRYKVNFNASILASGIYYFKIQSGNLTDMKKMVLIK